MPEVEDPLERVRSVCDRQGLKVRWDDTVSEPSANVLIGYSADGLRRRIEFGKDTLPYKADRNGRRRYALADIADYLAA
jgi:hypothetical protein